MNIFDKPESIIVNIWDDFYDDGYIPPGEKQGTRIYVEGEDNNEEAMPALIALNNHVLRSVYSIVKAHQITTNLFPGVSFVLNEDEITVTDMTHKQCDALMTILQGVSIQYDGRPVEFISES